MEQYGSITDTGLIWTCPKAGWYSVQISGHGVDSSSSGRLDFILTISGIAGDIEITDYTVAETSPGFLDRPIYSETLKFSLGQTMQPQMQSASSRKFTYINFCVTFVQNI